MKTLNYFMDLVDQIKAGTYTKIKHQREIDISKKHPNETLLKISSGVYRIGINYANLIENKNKVIGEATWGENVKGYERYFKKHQKKDALETSYYLKVFTTKHHRTFTYYILNNEIVSKKYLIENGYIKEEKPKELLMFTIELKNIIQIGS